MRGTDDHSGSPFSYVDLEARVPHDHPLRPIQALVDEALRQVGRGLQDVGVPLPLNWREHPA